MLYILQLLWEKQNYFLDPAKTIIESLQSYGILELVFGFTKIITNIEIYKATVDNEINIWWQ